jgi:hypothetical protein
MITISDTVIRKGKVQTLIFPIPDNAVHLARAAWIVPSLLHACQASRKIALEHYSLQFRANVHGPIFFNSEIDTLFIRGQYALRQFLTRTTLTGRTVIGREDERKLIRQIYLGGNDFMDSGSPGLGALSLLNGFENLEEVVMQKQ